LNAQGNVVPLTSSAVLCFEVNSTVSKSKSCLGYFDETSQKWVCQDSCLTSQKATTSNKQNLCGTTNHFTSFAILLTGTTSRCGNSNNLIFKDSWKDGVLIACVAGGIILILLVIAFFLAFTSWGSRILYGDEGMRVKSLRTNRISSTTPPTAPDEEEEIV
jgi:hypothetical protein